MMPPPSFTIPANPSPELQAALRWIEGYNRRDMEHILSAVTEDYIHYLLPESMGIKPRNKEESREFFMTFMPLFQEFTITIHDIVEAPGKIFFHATGKATSTTGFPYSNEYNFLLHVTPQRTGPHKVSVSKEFLDSKSALDFFAAEMERQAALDKE